MSRRKVWLRYAFGLGLAILACQQVWRHGHDYVFKEKFLVVEPGRLYRGAWQHDWPMRRIIRDEKIRTIVALAHQPTHHLAVSEKALATELGVRWLHIPIVESSVTAGQKRTVSASLEQAAAALADPANQPVFFHCHHGENRAAMVQMAYRMIYCGWTLDQATEEIRNSPVGLVEVDHGVDYRYMAEFYRVRVLPRRLAEQAKAKAVSVMARR